MYKFLLFLGIILVFSPASQLLHADASPEAEGTFKNTVTIGALDKVTARTSEITLTVGESVKIGTLMVTALRAWVSNPEDTPESKVFFVITEKKQGKVMMPLFRGWMFASNPSVSALEHPVYDIWVKSIEGEIVKGPPPSTETLDEATSAQIDDLIDQLIDQSNDEAESQTDGD